MQKLALPQVTLCAVDTRTPGLAWLSLQRSMALVDFAHVLLFTDAQGAAALPRAHDEGAAVKACLMSTLRDGSDYSRFVLRELPRHIHTPFVLVTQWDGFVVDAGAWRDEFMQWDYIGAPWPEQPDATAVGNGGFSLRSQRCLQAGLDQELTVLHPEDEVLCRSQRSLLQRKHDLRVAPLSLARRFSFENAAVTYPTFGFHGPYNLPRWLDENTLRQWLQALPSEFFRSRDARRLARALLAHRMPRAASELLQRRRAAGRTDPNTRLLGATAAVMKLWVAPTP